MKALLRCDQLTYIDVAGMRVVTNNRCIADKVENVATSGVNIEYFGKVGRCENSKNIVMDGQKI